MEKSPKVLHNYLKLCKYLRLAKEAACELESSKYLSDDTGLRFLELATQLAKLQAQCATHVREVNAVAY